MASDRDRSREDPLITPARAGVAGLLALPGVLTLYLCFDAGGFFAGTPSLVAVVLAALLVLRTTGSERPFAGLSGPAVAAAVALALFAVWTLVSVAWSGAPARALLEFERSLLYLLGFLLFGSLPQSSARLAWMARGLALAVVAVCGVALTTRVAPDLWPVAPNINNDRLSYPLTYWNALGLLAALGALMCLHFSADHREPVGVRVAAAAALPVVACTLLFTFSRGAIGAGALGLVAYLVLGRPRAVVGALVAAIPPVAYALSVAYDAEALQRSDPTGPTAVFQGEQVALTVLACMVAAAVLRFAAARFDDRLAAFRLGERLRRPVLAAAVLVPAVAVLVTLVAVDAPGYVEDKYNGFVEGRRLEDRGDIRSRLADPANNGRLDHWGVALDAFRASPLHGNGAGTYQLLWARDRPYAFTVLDGHSLYLEVLGELGLVGLALLAATLLILLAALARRVLRRPERRPLYALVLALTATWAVHAGVDWHWEMPAVTLWVFALGGLAIGAPRGHRPLSIDLPSTGRVAIALAWMALAVAPTLTVVSQSQLDRSRAALQGGDCATAVDAALDSIGALSMRAEAWELLGYCDVRLGQGSLAVRALTQAVELDRHSWEVHYGLALVRAAAGRDPRAAAREALRLNPREPLARAAIEAFDTTDRRRWRREALRSPLPLPGRP